MPPAALDLYQPGTSTKLDTLAFGTGDPGSPGSPIDFEIWSSQGDGTADTATGCFLDFFESVQGANEWHQAGRATMERWAEIQLTGTVGPGAVDTYTTGWQPVGTGRSFLMPPIAANSGRAAQIRLSVPGGVVTYAADYLLTRNWAQAYVPLALGFAESGLSGVRDGYGDGLCTELVEGGVLTAQGSPDSTVNLTDSSFVLQGDPYQVLEQILALGTTASDGAISGGEAFWQAISLSVGTVTITAGTKGTSPRDISARPTAPEGEILLGYVHNDGTVAGGDIYQDARSPGRLVLFGTGLHRKIGSGQAVVDNFLTRRESPVDVTFTASTADARLYALPTGGFAVVSGPVKPDPRAMELGRGVVGSSDLTSWTDMRRLLGRPQREIRFRFPSTLSTSSVAYATLGSSSPAFLSLPSPVVVSIDTAGSVPLSGRTAFEVEYWNGSAWVSLFTSSGSVDRRPAVAWNATDLSNHDARPEVLILPAFTPLRCRCIAIPTASAAPAGGEVVLLGNV